MKLMRSLCLSALAIALTTVVAHAQVAINEVDYDNPGVDVCEFVELVGRAGTVLDGWTLRGINANTGGTPGVYADYVLLGAIPYDFDSAWGGKGGFFVIGQFSTETFHRANAINETNTLGSYYETQADTNPNQGYGLDGLPNTADDGVWANTAPDFTPANWGASNNIENGSYGAGPGDILQLWDGVPEQSNLIDEWYYDYDPGYLETGLSEGIEAYDSAGSEDGYGLQISTLGRYGYSYGTPILVFDNEDMDGLDLFDREPNDGITWTYTGDSAFTSDNNLGDYGPFIVNPNEAFTENGSAQEILWSGMDGFTTKPAGLTPGTFNNVNFGDGSQDVFTINIGPETLDMIPGDTNNDGNVNEADAQTVANNWGLAVGNGAWDGDFNNDNVVNAIDASILAANWGNHGSSEAAATVPEPEAVLLLTFGLMMIAGRRGARS